MNIIRSVHNSIFKYLLFLLFICFFSSCITNKELEYFSRKVTDDISRYDYKYYLQVGDLLSVQISSVSEDKYDFFNKEKVANSQLMASNPYLYGYLIKQDSVLELPMIGEVIAVGNTTEELEQKIMVIASSYFKDPVVKINLLNFEIDILGAVNSPGRYKIIQPQINLIDAIAKAGDIKEFGNRKKIKLIRFIDNKPRIFYIDMSDNKFISDSRFFLEPNDIVYVPPNTKRFYAFKNLPSVISLGVSTITLYLLMNQD